VQRALLSSLVVASYLLFAGGPRWTLGPLLALAALGVIASPQRTLRLSRTWRALDLALIALVAAIAIQMVPLPAPLVSLLSPHALELRQAMQFSGMAAAPSWLPLSIDAEATAYALGTVVLGILSFLIARALFSAGGSSRRFCRLLAIVGAVAALASLVQKVLAPALVLGVLATEARNASPLGAFMNRNHFAAWLLMVSAVACGYLIAHVRIHPAYRGRWRSSVRQFLSSDALPTALAAIVTIGVLVGTLSRSAVAGLGAAAVTGWWMGRPRLESERMQVPAVLGLTGAGLLIFVLFVDLDGWAARIGQSFSGSTNGFSRTNIWRETVPIIGDFPLTGTGAGTYSEAMTKYQQTRLWVGSMQRWAHFNNAHSHYLQLASEGGLLLLAPVLACLYFLATMARRAVRADKGEMFWVRVGAAAGLVGLAVQSIWEVALIMPANAVLCGVLAGLLLYRRDGAEPPSSRELPRARIRMAQ
jgi:putative inorganic carbon (HCO3(-)) transporter